MYYIEEFKVWKGINTEEPTWAGINLVFETYQEGSDMIDYLMRTTKGVYRLMQR